MKTWVQKLVEQLGIESDSTDDSSQQSKKKKKFEKSIANISDDRATLLFMLDTYSKHLFEVENHPVRKTRETFDEISRELVDPESKAEPEKLLFRLRHLFLTYRVDEYTFIRKSFEDFKSILWDFVEQIGEDSRFEQVADRELQGSLKDLKAAVESESIDVLRTKSREFIDSYVEYNSKRDERRKKKITSIKKNLDQVKRKLVEAGRTMRTDHLSGAFNRKSFDEHIKNQKNFFEVTQGNVTLCILDIDHFKKVNDTYGHDIGDFVIKECVRTLHECFGRATDFVARIGGEEFAVVLQDHSADHSVKRAEELFEKIRKEVFIHQGNELRFTVSMGIAQLEEGFSVDDWVKRADQALYESKHNGRNRWTVAAAKTTSIKKVS